jgi:VanZ family protein
MMKTSKIWWFWLCLTLSVTAFIIYNGVQTADDSLSASGSLIALLQPILDAIVSLIGQVDWQFWIRKGAHFTEYALLGFCSFSFAKQVGKKHNRPFYAHGALYVLLVAVTDEFLQGFVGRTSAVYDVLIDFGGGLFGFFIAILVGFLWHNILQKRSKKK